jgi:hypothetical protein
MAARFGVLLTVALAALPTAARADGVNYTVPDHYLVEAAPPPGQPYAVYRVWGRYLDGVRHSIVASASSSTSDLTALMDATVAQLGARHAIDVSRTDAPQVCGMPSVQIAYAFPNQLAYVFRYAVVGGRLLIVSYAHPVGSSADPTALASLDTSCSGIHQPATPNGWTLEAPYPPNANAWRPASGGGTPAHAGTTLLDQVASAAKPERALLGPYAGKGAVVADRQDACGAIAIRRVTVNLDDGRVLERAAGTAYAYDYIVTYTRPASDPADPGAIATLTSFCTGTLPPS